MENMGQGFEGLSKMKPNGGGGGLISCGLVPPLGCLCLWIQYFEKQFPIFNLTGAS